MTVEGEVIFLFGAVFNSDLTDFVTSDNVCYVRLDRLFTHYNDFNGTKMPPIIDIVIVYYLIVKDQKSILSMSHLLFLFS
jgi:hypothetical protein